MTTGESRTSRTSISNRSHKGSQNDFYADLDADINGLIGGNMGFDALIRTQPYPISDSHLAGFRARYRSIKAFQRQATLLFNASLRGDCDPGIARMVVCELPESLGVDYHRDLTERQSTTPVFFRTDEPSPGIVSEIQCCGSGWGLAEQLHRLYKAHSTEFGSPHHFTEPLSACFSKALRSHLNADPRIHHLVDNASRPHGIRYFIERTRDFGLRYFSYDFDVSTADCNFVRSHDFISLPYHNFFDDRLARCERGELLFDLPPSSLFDGKLIMAWPYWSRTREHFSDDVRALFPYSAVVEAPGFELEDGEHISIDALSELPRSERNYYLKYAGTDIGINWGSKSVYLLSNMSRVEVRKLLAGTRAEVARGRPWIVQRASRHREEASAFARDGSIVCEDGYTKLSGFYGPEGLMGILGMQKRFHKVHGGCGTIMSVVY
jgi:hypothetical protein